MISRILNLSHEYSYLLLGPRQTGKSTYIRNFLKHSGTFWEVNLLKNATFLKLSKDPSLFRSEALYQIQEKKAGWIFVDEIQKIPSLLDEVHLLVEETPCKFILSGSSARKLKREGSNLLAGRAIVKSLFPFIYSEIKTTFHLDRALQFGLLPGVLSKPDSLQRSILRTYCQTYLKEEIQAEGIARNLGGFSRFLEVAAQSFSEVVNYSNIGEQSHLSAKTVQNYFEILVDTLIGYFLPVWNRSVRKQLTIHPKFYFFDNGLTCGLLERLKDPLDAPFRGRLFKQWLIHEVRANLSYHESETQIYTWRTTQGEEVDLVLSHANDPIVAIEFKSHSQIFPKQLRGLQAFREEYPNVLCLVVCEVEEPRLEDKIKILPWKIFLTEYLHLFK